MIQGYSMGMVQGMVQSAGQEGATWRRNEYDNIRKHRGGRMRATICRRPVYLPILTKVSRAVVCMKAIGHIDQCLQGVFFFPTQPYYVSMHLKSAIVQVLREGEYCHLITPNPNTPLSSIPVGSLQRVVSPTYRESVE